VDTLGAVEPVDASAPAPAEGSGAQARQALFIVARGHPELVAQLKAVLGHASPVHVIEDRRRAPRD
jgi:hypothetical protein